MALPNIQVNLHCALQRDFLQKFVVDQNYHDNVKALFDLRVWKGVSKAQGSLLGDVSYRAKSDLQCTLSHLNLACPMFTVGQRLKDILPASTQPELTGPPV